MAHPPPGGGLNTTYSLYFGFNGTGTGTTPPPPGSASTGPFTKLDYTLFAVAGPTPTFTVTNGNVTVSGAGAFPLAFGSLISGTATLTNTGVGAQPFSPTANLFETFNVCTAAGQGNAGFGQALCTGNESGFFLVPPPGTINLVVGNFSATTSITSFDGTFLNINGGGGNLALENRVPEPMSLTLLGVGLLGLAGLSRRKLIKRSELPPGSVETMSGGLARPPLSFFAAPRRREMFPRCGIGSCGVPRPSLGGYVTGTGPMDRVTAAGGRSCCLSVSGGGRELPRRVVTSTGPLSRLCSMLSRLCSTRPLRRSRTSACRTADALNHSESASSSAMDSHASCRQRTFTSGDDTTETAASAVAGRL